jgi:membrane protein
MLYLANFSSYNQIYGSIGAVVVLMMWFWFSSYAVLLGAALNAVMPRRGQ